MPKKREYQKETTWNKNVQRKFRVGNRKSGVSALFLSTKELVAILANKDKKKWHKKVASVLKHRGNIGSVA